MVSGKYHATPTALFLGVQEVSIAFFVFGLSLEVIIKNYYELFNVILTSYSHSLIHVWVMIITTSQQKCAVMLVNQAMIYIETLDKTPYSYT